MSAGVFALLGVAAWGLRPGVRDGRLSPEGRTIFLSLGAAMLEGSLPVDVAARAAALEGMLVRLDDLVAGLPGHVRQELSELLSLLHTAAGRRALAGLPEPWAEASVPQVQAALQSMRLSSLLLRRQAYQALHDLVGGTYFSDPATWVQLGYPGPMDI